MKIREDIALVSLFSMFLIQHCLGGAVSGIGDSDWTCTCFSSHDQSHVSAYKCSSSCDCRPGDTDQWRCSCPANGFPKVTGEGSSDSSCFTSCLCSAGPVAETDAPNKQSFPMKIVLAVLLSCVLLSTIAFLATVIIYICRKNNFPGCSDLKNRKRTASQPKTIGSSSATGCFRDAFIFCFSRPKTFPGTIIELSYTELEQATKKFSNNNLIGNGGSSRVYRGQLKDGRIAAIKRLTVPEGPDSDSVFFTEVELLSRLHHCHVVSLIGYCSESRAKHAERLLVFEHMPNGSLRDCLDGDAGQTMTWHIRVSIAIGAARGLEYLHEAAAPRILHRDVKSTNILLDSNWHARITDLGMAKCVRTEEMNSSGASSPTSMRGTFGYFAPEYAMAGHASLMSDVFSFGVVLLELITGRKPIQNNDDNNGEGSLVIWATTRLHESKRVITELPDPRLDGKFPEEEMQIMAYLAKECLLLEPESRPTMREVVQILSTIAPDTSRCRDFSSNLAHFQLSCSDKKEENRDDEEIDIDLIVPRFESF